MMRRDPEAFYWTMQRILAFAIILAGALAGFVFAMGLTK
jgi:hypothetical protein